MRYDAFILDPLKDVLARVTSFVPTLLMALGILFIGWVISRFIRKLLLKGFKVMHFDTLSDSIGLSSILRNGGIKHKPSEMLSCLVYTVLMIAVFIMTIKSLGLTVASDVIDQLLAYVPSVLSGVFILIVGMLLAKVVSSLVYVTAKNTDMPIPETLSRLSKWAIVAYVTIMFLKEIGFVSLFVPDYSTIFVGGVVFALALAFGLAGRDIAHRYLDVFNVKK